MLGGIGGRRRRGPQRMRWLGGITDLMDMSLSRLQKLVIDREAGCGPWGSKDSDTTERLNELTNQRRTTMALHCGPSNWTQPPARPARLLSLQWSSSLRPQARDET